MKIISIKRIGPLSTHSGSGTGCSVPDICEVTVEDNGKMFTKKVLVDIWYQPIKNFHYEFIHGIYRKFDKRIENIEEGFKMWAEETLSHYSTNKDEFEKIYGFSY